jgi:UDP-N-acetylglucosamine:LPS N-acetylglucosamine transferase
LDAYLVGSPEVNIKRKIGLTEEKPVLLVMGGGLGMGRYQALLFFL